MVHGQQHGVLARGQAQERRAQQRPAGEVERAHRLGRGQPQGLRLPPCRCQAGEINHGQGNGAVCADGLARRPTRGRKGGAQHRVAAHHLGQRAPQHHRVEAAAQAESRRDVVGRAARL